MKKSELRRIIKEEIVLYESKSLLINTFTKLAKLPLNKLKTVLKSGWSKLKKEFIDNGKEEEALAIINKGLKKNYKTLDQIDKNVNENEAQLNEDFAHYFESLKNSIYVSTLVMSMLEIWIQLSKLIEGDTPNYKRLVIFGVGWLFFATLKYLESWRKWKKATS